MEAIWSEAFHSGNVIVIKVLWKIKGWHKCRIWTFWGGSRLWHSWGSWKEWCLKLTFFSAFHTVKLTLESTRRLDPVTSGERFRLIQRLSPLISLVTLSLFSQFLSLYNRLEHIRSSSSSETKSFSEEFNTKLTWVRILFGCRLQKLHSNQPQPKRGFSSLVIKSLWVALP